MNVAGVRKAARRNRSGTRSRFGAHDCAHDAWSRDEWWRAHNPGSSVFRGVLWALALSAVLWVGLILTVWSVLR